MIGIDTNVLVYLSGHDDAEKQTICASVLGKLEPSNVFVSMLVMAELHYVVSRLSRSKDQANRWIEQVERLCRVGDITVAALPGALELVSRHGHQIFDALILEQCALANCVVLLTEGGHHGFVWKGCTVVSPFQALQHPLLSAAVAPSSH